jgi:hypothetical protein
MVSREDISRKSNEELMQIYARQNDYLPEVVAMVREEIAHREMDVSNVHVITQEEVAAVLKEKKTRSARRKVWFVAGLQGILGLFFVGLSAPMIVQDKNPRAILSIGIGVLLLFFAYSVWKLKFWSLVLGTIIYSLSCVSNMIILVLSLSNGGNNESQIHPLFYTILSGSFAVAFLNMVRTGRAPLNRPIEGQADRRTS